MTKMKHVLLIDDNDMDNYISNHIISKNNLAEKISVKTSALDALDYLNELQKRPDEFPNLIFLDIRMPAMDGFEFLEEFVKMPLAANKKCDVVMLTSSSDKSDIERASKYPVVKKYLNKPLEIDMLANLHLQN